MTSTSFRRQVVLRIDAEDWSLLEDAARDHGSQQAALMEGLRALRRLRDPAATAEPATLRPPHRRSKHDTPLPPGSPVAAVAAAPDDAWWASLDFAGEVLGLDAPQLRRRIRDSSAQTRKGADGQEVRLDQLQIGSAHAAHLLSVSPETLRSYAKRGEQGAVRRKGRYYFPLGQIEIGVNEVATRLEVTPDAARARIDRGELPHRRDEHGRRRIRLLDVIDALGQADEPTAAQGDGRR